MTESQSPQDSVKYLKQNDMKHLIFFALLMMNSTLLFAGDKSQDDKGNISTYECLQGAWGSEETYGGTLYGEQLVDEDGNPVYDENGDPMYDSMGYYRTKFLLVKDHEMMYFEYERFEYGGYGSEIKYDSVPVLASMGKYEFKVVSDKQRWGETSAISSVRADITEGFSNKVLDKIHSKTIATLQIFDTEQGEVRRDSMIHISKAVCSSETLEYNRTNFNRDGLTDYFLQDLFIHSISSKKDYFTHYMNTKVGVMTGNAENPTEKIVTIKDEKIFYYYIEPWEDDGDLKEGWVKKKKVKLLSDMVR